MKKYYDKILFFTIILIVFYFLWLKVFTINDTTIILSTIIAVFSYLFQKNKEIEIKKKGILEKKYSSILVFMSIVLFPETIFYCNELNNSFMITKLKIDLLNLNKTDFDNIKSYYLKQIKVFNENNRLYSNNSVYNSTIIFLQNPNNENYENVIKEMHKDLWN